MPIRIMYLLDRYEGPRAGTEAQLLQLLTRLDRSRYEPALTLLRTSRYVESARFPCPVSVLGITRLASVKTMVRMVRYALALRRENYRLVHCFFNDSAVIAPLFLKLAGIRVVVSRRDMGFWYTPATLLALRLVMPFVDRYVANSRVVKRMVQAREWVPSNKVTVIYNGYVDSAAAVRPAQEREAVAALANYHPLVGIVANLRPVKRIDTLLEAFALVRRKHPRCGLVIVGDTCSEQARAVLPHLQALTRQLCIHDSVVFTGSVMDARPYVEKFSVAVLCSESEGLSNALIEYMAAKRPIVCTDTGGNPELVQDGHNGFLVPVCDPSTLADRLIHLLADAELAKRFGERGHAMMAPYTIAKMVNEHMDCYDQIRCAIAPPDKKRHLPDRTPSV